MDKNIEQSLKDQQERRDILIKALADVPQACIDLMCVVVGNDTEKRSASYWLGEAFAYTYKYQDRLRKYAQERKEAQERKQNEVLFSKYIAMTPPKTALELLTLMQRFGIAPQVPIPGAVAAPVIEAKAS